MMNLKFDANSLSTVVKIGRAGKQVPSDEVLLRELFVEIDVEMMSDEFKEMISTLHAENIDMVCKVLENYVLIIVSVDGEIFLYGELKNNKKFGFHTELSEEALYLAKTAIYIWNGMQHIVMGNIDVAMTVKELSIDA